MYRNKELDASRHPHGRESHGAWPIPAPDVSHGGPASSSFRATLEAALSPSGEPVLGLRLRLAYSETLASFFKDVGQGEISPTVVTLLALVESRPGISQIELAKLMRVERATIGTHVARCLAGKYIKRLGSPEDKRKYALLITPHGRTSLRRLRDRLRLHEKKIAERLSAEERATLLRILDKLTPR